VTVGFFKAGSAYNVIPGDVHIGGTTRTTSPENRALVQRRIEEICRGAEQMHGVKIEIEHKPGYPPTVNNAERARFAIDVAAGVCGEHAVKDNVRPSMGAEDFSYMLERVPGAMVWLGNGGGDDAVSLHNSRYDFNDMAIPFGVSFFVRTVERFLGDQPA
jgi:metal-dependent amidase/aminoacylase/carboxypeptidase family protein